MTFRTSGSRFRNLAALISTAVFVLASGWMTTISAQDASATPTETPVPTPTADSPRVELQFVELNDSGVTGTATLYQYGDKTIVELDLKGTGQNHPAHIHAGTCDLIEPQPAFNLENVGEDGKSRSLVDTSLQNLLDHPYVIDLHRAPNELGTLIVCAQIEGVPEVPGTGGQIGTATPEVTVPPTEAPSPTPTESQRATPTAVPTQESTQSATEIGVGGTGAETTPPAGVGGDGTDGGKGIPLTETGKGDAIRVGGASSTGGDGTTGSFDRESGKGVPVSGPSGLPERTGSGSSLFAGNAPSRLLPIAAIGLSVMMLAAGILVRRWESMPGR